MEQPTTQDSTKFPRGYGDFALQCSDGIVCHFPPYLLEHTSGFFKDMFSLPNCNEDNIRQASTSQPLPLSEPSRTVELLLQHMDPALRAPFLDPTTVVDLLEAAQKYQVPKVIEWFEDEVVHKRGRVYASTPVSGILLENPCLVLYCALRFDLPNSGKLALREFAQCRSNLLESPPKELTLHVYLHGMALRKERIALFRTFVTRLGKLKTIGMMGYMNEMDEWGDYEEVDTGRKTCATCTADRVLWLLDLEEATRETPTWVSFVAAYERGGKRCLKCGTEPWSAYYRDSLKEWEKSVTYLEASLPAWSF